MHIPTTASEIEDGVLIPLEYVFRIKIKTIRAPAYGRNVYLRRWYAVVTDTIPADYKRRPYFRYSENIRDGLFKFAARFPGYKNWPRN